MAVDAALLFEHIQRAPQRAAADAQLVGESSFGRDSSVGGDALPLDEIEHLAQRGIASVHMPQPPSCGPYHTIGLGRHRSAPAPALACRAGG
jgi:hypothetical protein